MKKTLVLSLLVGLAGAAVGLQAQSAAPAQPASAPARQTMDLARFKMALTDERRKLFAAGMSNLTAAQLEAFWAVYGDYEKEKDAITAARLEILRKYVESYSVLSDAEIASMVNEAADTQKKNSDLRVKYFGIYSQKINAKAAGRFVLIDDYITTALRLSLLNQLPLPMDETR
jgi:Spy/CpxP family protein refolding chaperone